jgi:CRISPR-associated endonuclease/helicase Cas3
MEHGQRRVIVAVPFVTITEQTAATYRAIFNDQSEERPIVLEHHSGVTGRDDDEGDAHPNAVWSRLAAENWDAPIIVTTTVQLFESMFANGTSKCRKLHRLAKSVIILDEAQALPTGLLAPILDGLKELCAHYGTTVVISTATQPAFESIPAFGDVAKDAPEIVPNPARYFDLLKRVIYDWRLERPLAWEEVAELMRGERQALAIVNTKKDALALLDALGKHSGALHLSTMLCGRHRQRVIDEVKQRLAAGKPCLLVSTQVVEAGVDLDFPLVLRALGPLDSIIQAAGRCNRGGNLAHGRVIIFRPEEERMPPGAYTIATKNTGTWRAQGNRDPDNPSDVRDYFRQFYGMLALDAKGIQSLRETFNYPKVAAEFQMIDDETESVVVRDYGTDKERRTVAGLIEQLRYGVPYARALLRRLQPYTVSVRVREAGKYRNQGLITDIVPSVGEWHGKYDPTRGLAGDAHDPDKLVF